MKNVEVKIEFLEWINAEIADRKQARDKTGNRRVKQMITAQIDEIYLVREKLKEFMVVRTNDGEEFN